MIVSDFECLVITVGLAWATAADLGFYLWLTSRQRRGCRMLWLRKLGYASSVLLALSYGLFYLFGTHSLSIWHVAAFVAIASGGYLFALFVLDRSGS